MPRIIRFEIHASRPQVLIDFYSAVLGWSFSHVAAIGFWRIQTDPSDRSGIEGGLVPRPGAAPGATQAVNAFICTVEVASLDETFAKAVASGAVVALPKFPVPGMGLLAYIKDPDGNMLGLLQPEELSR